MLATSAWRRTLPLVRPFACGTASQPSHRLLRPRLTSRSGSTPSPFQAQGEISPGKNALLHCTTAGSTPLPLDHESFAVHGPLALVGNAFYPLLVHRPAASLHASSPHSVALMQLRFARCDQLTMGLAPIRGRPCWAHQKKGAAARAAAPSMLLVGRLSPGQWSVELRQSETRHQYERASERSSCCRASPRRAHDADPERSPRLGRRRRQ